MVTIKLILTKKRLAGHCCQNKNVSPLLDVKGLQFVIAEDKNDKTLFIIVVGAPEAPKFARAVS
jgi:hypothetical protein